MHYALILNRWFYIFCKLIKILLASPSEQSLEFIFGISSSTNAHFQLIQCISVVIVDCRLHIATIFLYFQNCACISFWKELTEKHIEHILFLSTSCQVQKQVYNTLCNVWLLHSGFVYLFNSIPVPCWVFLRPISMGRRQKVLDESCPK